MNTGAHSEAIGHDLELAAAGNLDIEQVEVNEPTPPPGLAQEEEHQLKDRSLALVSQLLESSGSKEMELADSITGIGIQSQKRAGAELELLKVRMGKILSQDGPGTQISKELVDLRVTLNQISPNQMGDSGVVGRVMSMIPFVGGSALRTLEKIAIRYEPVARQVSLIETSLRNGRAILARDNIELRKLYQQVEEQQISLRKNAYMAELVMQQLADVLERIDDPMKRERIRNVRHDVAMRAQDLRTMEEVNLQFFVSIEMTRQNNNRLGQSVERTLALGTNVVMVGLALQVALARERDVMLATQRTREFLGNLIVANAAAIKRHTEEIGDVYNNPVIALEKITQAHNDLIEAMNMADRLKQQGIEAARENIARLTELSAGLTHRSQGLREDAGATFPSIEA